jgi:hypothetical protein
MTVKTVSHAVYRPRLRDVLIIRGDCESFAIPIDQVDGLIASLAKARDMPELAASMAGIASDAVMADECRAGARR